MDFSAIAKCCVLYFGCCGGFLSADTEPLLPVSPAAPSTPGVCEDDETIVRFHMPGRKGPVGSTCLTAPNPMAAFCSPSPEPFKLRKVDFSEEAPTYPDLCQETAAAHEVFLVKDPLDDYMATVHADLVASKTAPPKPEPKFEYSEDEE